MLQYGGKAAEAATASKAMLTILASILLSVPKSERINVLCAKAVGIPYASDTFTDREWAAFEKCRRLHRK